MEKDRNLATGHQRPLNNVLYINVREYQRRNKKMDNPEKLATYKTKQSKDTTRYMLGTTIRKQTQKTYIRHEPSYKKLKVKTNRKSFSIVAATCTSSFTCT